jgi:hypothetical protein
VGHSSRRRQCGNACEAKSRRLTFEGVKEIIEKALAILGPRVPHAPGERNLEVNTRGALRSRENYRELLRLVYQLTVRLSYFDALTPPTSRPWLWESVLIAADSSTSGDAM